MQIVQNSLSDEALWNRTLMLVKHYGLSTELSCHVLLQDTIVSNSYAGEPLQDAVAQNS
jgi:hypothetical protein